MKKTFWILGILSIFLFIVGCGKEKEEEEDYETPVGKGRGDIENPYYIHKNITASTFWAGEGEGAANGNISNVESAWGTWGDYYTVNGQAKEDKPSKSFQRDKDFIPKGYDGSENLYYFALPYDDCSKSVFDGDASSYNAVINLDPDNYERGRPEGEEKEIVVTKAYTSYRKNNAKQIPWYGTETWSKKSVVKARWVRVRSFERGGNGQWVYAQWLDAGPYHYDDFDYVFGDANYRNSNSSTGKGPFAGIDLSPAVMLKMGVSYDELGSQGINLKVEWQFEDPQHVPNGPWKRVVSNNKTNW
jgi:hypothetical protein